MNEADGGEGHGGGVVEEGPEQVLTDGPEGGGGELEGVGHPAEVGSQEDDSGGFACDIRGAGDSDAEVSCGEGGTVVDAIADESDAATGGAELTEGLGLAFGTDARVDELRVDAGFACDGLGGEGMISGKHADLKTGLTKALDGIVCFGAEGIAEGEDAPEVGTCGEDDRGGALSEPGIEEGLGRGEIDAGVGCSGEGAELDG